MSRKHVVISGTGRAGTTFLTELLTHLGLDTGFDANTLTRDYNARAGMELDIREPNAPYVVKSPWFCDYADEVLNCNDIEIEHVFIPMRDLHAAAQSRRHVVKTAVPQVSWFRRITRKHKPSKIEGGLWHTNNESEQESILLHQVYKLILALSATTIPVTSLRYPTLAKDSRYLYRKLKPLLEGISHEHFEEVFKQTVRPDWIHSFNNHDR